MNPFWASFMLVYVNWFRAITFQMCPGSSTCENGIKSSNMAFFQVLIMVLKHNIMREILSILSCLLILLYKYRAIQAWKTQNSSLKSSQKALQKALQKLFKKLSRNQRIGASHISRFRSLSIDIKPQTILLKSSRVLQGPRAIHHTPSTPPIWQHRFGKILNFESLILITFYGMLTFVWVYIEQLWMVES